MEVILEVRDGGTTRSRHRVGALPFTIGRGPANDLVLDDPYVDARHARLARDARGALVVEDLASVNGLVSGAARLRGAVAVRAGDELRLGRTTLRFRDPQEEVAPALVDEGDAPAPPPAATPAAAPAAAPAVLLALRDRGRRAVDAALASPPRRGLVLAVVTGLFAAYSWFGSTARSGAGDAFGAALAFATLASLWAAVWAAAGRSAMQAFHFSRHLAFASLAAAAALLLAIAAEWLAFVLPDSPVATALSSALFLAWLVATLAGHLGLASPMPAARRWRGALATVGVFFGLGAVAALTSEDRFSDVPTFSGTLKPWPTALLPTATVDEFGGVMRELRAEVDELADEQAAEDGRAAAPAPSDSTRP